tara:strand:- start:6 stop:410 length:405 start_codon:yes stop_codon:yes gene_type:complete
MDKKHFIKRLNESNPIKQIKLIDDINDMNLDVNKVYSGFIKFQSLKQKMTMKEYNEIYNDCMECEEENILVYNGCYIYINKKGYSLEIIRDFYKSVDLEYLELILYIDWYLFEIEDYTKYLNFRVNDSKNMSWK